MTNCTVPSRITSTTFGRSPVSTLVTVVTGTDPVLGGAPDLDLDLLDSLELDGRTLELTYRPHVRRTATAG